MTPLEWVELRCCASLVHAVPGMRVRVGYAGCLVFDVGSRAEGGDEGAGSQVGACQFRSAVARAWREVGDPSPGGAPADVAARPAARGGPTALTIEVTLPDGAAELPGGICRVPLGERDVYVFATTASIGAIREEIAGTTDGLEPIPGVWGVGVRADPATEIALVYCEVDRHHRRSAPIVIDLLLTLSTRLAVEQLIDEARGRSRPNM